MLIDKLGSKQSVLFFASLEMIGLSIASLTANESLLNFRLFLIGWAIFGMGVVGTLIWYSSINSVFFFYNHNAMSMALLVCFTAFGTSLADILVPFIYKGNPSLTDVIMVSIYVQIGAFVCVLLINRTERLSTIKRNNLRYIRIATKKYTEARRKGRFRRSEAGSDPVSDVSIRSFINENSQYFLQLRRIIFYP